MCTYTVEVVSLCQSPKTQHRLPIEDFVAMTTQIFGTRAPLSPTPTHSSTGAIAIAVAIKSQSHIIIYTHTHTLTYMTGLW